MTLDLSATIFTQHRCIRHFNVAGAVWRFAGIELEEENPKAKIISVGSPNMTILKRLLSTLGGGMQIKGVGWRGQLNFVKGMKM